MKKNKESGESMMKKKNKESGESVITRGKGKSNTNAGKGFDNFFSY